MELNLADLIDDKRIVQIDAVPIPGFPGAARKGNHLFVNCHYAVGISGHTPRTELYEAARTDVLKIVRKLVNEPTVRDFLSIHVRVIGHFPYSGMTRPAIRRIYSVSIDVDRLPTDEASITLATLPRMEAFESSQLEEAPPTLDE